MIVAFTGHRPDKLGGYGPSPLQEWVREQIRMELKALKPVGAISGMALGVDTWAAEECVSLGIPFVAAIPFKGQESRWPNDSQERYRALLARAMNYCIVNTGEYAAWKMQKRNEWMVDRCTTLIAVYNSDQTGGTRNCVEYAKKVGRRIVTINPNNFDVPH